MKLKLCSVLAITVLLSVSSCSQDDPNELDVSKEIKVSASIDGADNSGVKTRASDTSWDNGDAIGVFMKKTDETLSSALESNIEYVTDGTDKFAPASNAILLLFHSEAVDFIAYYPYTSSLDGLNYSIDVSDQSNLESIDLMYANNEVGINSSTDVNLSFVHQLSKIDLSITMEEGVPALTGLIVEITDVYTKALFSLDNGSIISESESNPQNISFKVNEDGTLAEAILIPNKSLTDKRLVFKLGETSYSYDLNKTTIEKFDKSTKYTLKVKLKPGVGAALELTSTSISDWTKGAEENIEADENKL